MTSRRRNTSRKSYRAGGKKTCSRKISTAKRVMSSTKRFIRKVKFQVKRIGHKVANSAGAFRTKWQVEHQSVGIGSLRKSKLTQFGYHTNLNKTERAAALSKAVKEYGALSTYRSLNAIAIYNKNTHPAVAEAAKEDRDMIRKKFF